MSKNCVSKFTKHFFCINKLLLFNLLLSLPLSEWRRYCDAWRLCLCVCVSVRQAATVRHINLGGDGNARYQVLSGCVKLMLFVIYNKKLSYRLETGRQQRISL